MINLESVLSRSTQWTVFIRFVFDKFNSAARSCAFLSTLLLLKIFFKCIKTVYRIEINFLMAKIISFQETAVILHLNVIFNA